MNSFHLSHNFLDDQESCFLSVEEREDHIQKGVCYEKGEGVEQSYPYAFYHYQLAVGPTCSKAYVALAKLYEHDLETIQSHQQAFYYSFLAANQHDALALYSLARFFLERFRVLSFGCTSREYYKFAAENGLKIGYDKAGYCYQELGGEENQKKTIAYFQLGAKEKEP